MGLGIFILFIIAAIPSTIPFTIGIILTLVAVLGKKRDGKKHTIMLVFGILSIVISIILLIVAIVFSLSLATEFISDWPY